MSDSSRSSSSSPSSISPNPTFVVHGRIELALHTLRTGSNGHPLLILHALGDRSPTGVPLDLAGWSGPVFALDFTGHGASSSSIGGGYSTEVLMADVDAALDIVGECTVVGRGLGGYIALLIAGARPKVIRGAIIDDGVGLLGGGAVPLSSHMGMASKVGSREATPDPYAFLELSTDVRPGDYAATYARAAAEGSNDAVSIAVVTALRPPWITAILEQYGVEALSLPDALALFAT
jgi:pimeloyl-ACP methyl ester carboxylesterase